MKWKTKIKKKPYSYKEGDQRIVKRFLLWPLSLNGETRWLCLTSIKQKFSHVMVADDVYICKWINTFWG